MPTASEPDLRYELIRSRRRTLSLIVRDDGSLEIRCPLRYPQRQIDRFIQDKSAWIARKRQENRQIIPVGRVPEHLRQQANQHLTERARHLMNRYACSQPVRLSVRDQRSRWGSCSSRGHIAINRRCYLLPDALQDYVIMHEICHLTQMNHSADFWRLLGQYVADARNRRQELRQYRLTQEESQG